MKQLALMTLIGAFLFPLASHAQKAKDILENSKPLKDGTVILLKYQNGELKYSNREKPTSFIPLRDSLYFVTREDAVNVFIGALNPLNYSATHEIKFSDDLIDKAEEQALASITNLMMQMQGIEQKKSEQVAQLQQKVDDKSAQVSDPKANKKAKQSANSALAEIRDSLRYAKTENKKFLILVNDVVDLRTALANNQKESINKEFGKLKKLTFVNRMQVEKGLTDVKGGMTVIESVFKSYDIKIDTLKKHIDEYNQSTAEDYVVRFVFTETENKLNQVLSLLKQRLANLQKAYDLVNKSLDDSQEVPGYTNIGTINLTKNKVGHLTVFLNEEGIKLDDESEMVSMDKKILVSKTINVRKHQLFVPEVAVGIAYTFLSFPRFGTGTDAAGNTVVVDAGNQNFQRLNVTAMLNYNYFIPGANIHPFFQIGVGAKSDYPTLLTGAGIRIAGGLGRRLAISGGFASSWVDQLNKLKVGDKVGGTADIEADVTHELKFPLKPYLGIQINF